MLRRLLFLFFILVPSLGYAATTVTFPNCNAVSVTTDETGGIVNYNNNQNSVNVGGSGSYVLNPPAISGQAYSFTMFPVGDNGAGTVDCAAAAAGSTQTTTSQQPTETKIIRADVHSATRSSLFHLNYLDPKVVALTCEAAHASAIAEINAHLETLVGVREDWKTILDRWSPGERDRLLEEAKKKYDDFEKERSDTQAKLDSVEAQLTLWKAMINYYDKIAIGQIKESQSGSKRAKKERDAQRRAAIFGDVPSEGNLSRVLQELLNLPEVDSPTSPRERDALAQKALDDLPNLLNEGLNDPNAVTVGVGSGSILVSLGNPNASVAAQKALNNLLFQYGFGNEGKLSDAGSRLQQILHQAATAGNVNPSLVSVAIKNAASGMSNSDRTRVTSAVLYAQRQKQLGEIAKNVNADKSLVSAVAGVFALGPVSKSQAKQLRDQNQKKYDDEILDVAGEKRKSLRDDLITIVAAIEVVKDELYDISEKETEILRHIDDLDFELGAARGRVSTLELYKKDPPPCRVAEIGAVSEGPVVPSTLAQAPERSKTTADFPAPTGPAAGSETPSGDAGGARQCPDRDQRLVAIDAVLAETTKKIRVLKASLPRIPRAPDVPRKPEYPDAACIDFHILDQAIEQYAKKPFQELLAASASEELKQFVVLQTKLKELNAAVSKQQADLTRAQTLEDDAKTILRTKENFVTEAKDKLQVLENKIATLYRALLRARENVIAKNPAAQESTINRDQAVIDAQTAYDNLRTSSQVSDARAALSNAENEIRTDAYARELATLRTKLAEARQRRIQADNVHKASMKDAANTTLQVQQLENRLRALAQKDIDAKRVGIFKQLTPEILLLCQRLKAQHPKDVTQYTAALALYHDWERKYATELRLQRKLEPEIGSLQRYVVYLDLLKGQPCPEILTYAEWIVPFLADGGPGGVEMTGGDGGAGGASGGGGSGAPPSDAPGGGTGGGGKPNDQVPGDGAPTEPTKPVQRSCDDLIARLGDMCAEFVKRQNAQRQNSLQLQQDSKQIAQEILSSLKKDLDNISKSDPLCKEKVKQKLKEILGSALPVTPPGGVGSDGGLPVGGDGGGGAGGRAGGAPGGGTGAPPIDVPGGSTGGGGGTPPPPPPPKPDDRTSPAEPPAASEFESFMRDNKEQLKAMLAQLRNAALSSDELKKVTPLELYPDILRNSIMWFIGDAIFDITHLIELPGKLEDVFVEFTTLKRVRSVLNNKQEFWNSILPRLNPRAKEHARSVLTNLADFLSLADAKIGRIIGLKSTSASRNLQEQFLWENFFKLREISDAFESLALDPKRHGELVYHINRAQNLVDLAIHDGNFRGDLEHEALSKLFSELSILRDEFVQSLGFFDQLPTSGHAPILAAFDALLGSKKLFGADNQGLIKEKLGMLRKYISSTQTDLTKSAIAENSLLVTEFSPDVLSAAQNFRSIALDLSVISPDTQEGIAAQNYSSTLRQYSQDMISILSGIRDASSAAGKAKNDADTKLALRREANAIAALVSLLKDSRSILIDLRNKNLPEDQEGVNKALALLDRLIPKKFVIFSSGFDVGGPLVLKISKIEALPLMSGAKDDEVASNDEADFRRAVEEAVAGIPSSAATTASASTATAGGAAVGTYSAINNEEFLFTTIAQHPLRHAGKPPFALLPNTLPLQFLVKSLLFAPPDVLAGVPPTDDFSKIVADALKSFYACEFTPEALCKKIHEAIADKLKIAIAKQKAELTRLAEIAESQSKASDESRGALKKVYEDSQKTVADIVGNIVAKYPRLKTWKTKHGTPFADLYPDRRDAVISLFVRGDPEGEALLRQLRSAQAASQKAFDAWNGAAWSGLGGSLQALGSNIKKMLGTSLFNDLNSYIDAFAGDCNARVADLLVKVRDRVAATGGLISVIGKYTIEDFDSQIQTQLSQATGDPTVTLQSIAALADRVLDNIVKPIIGGPMAESQKLVCDLIAQLKKLMETAASVDKTEAEGDGSSDANARRIQDFVDNLRTPGESFLRCDTRSLNSILCEVWRLAFGLVENMALDLVKPIATADPSFVGVGLSKALQRAGNSEMGSTPEERAANQRDAWEELVSASPALAKFRDMAGDVLPELITEIASHLARLGNKSLSLEDSLPARQFNIISDAINADLKLRIGVKFLAKLRETKERCNPLRFQPPDLSAMLREVSSDALKETVDFILNSLPLIRTGKALASALSDEPGLQSKFKALLESALTTQTQQIMESIQRGDQSKGTKGLDQERRFYVDLLQKAQATLNTFLEKMYDKGKTGTPQILEQIHDRIVKGKTDLDALEKLLQQLTQSPKDATAIQAQKDKIEQAERDRDLRIAGLRDQTIRLEKKCETERNQLYDQWAMFQRRLLEERDSNIVRDLNTLRNTNDAEYKRRKADIVQRYEDEYQRAVVPSRADWEEELKQLEKTCKDEQDALRRDIDALEQTKTPTPDTPDELRKKQEKELDALRKSCDARERFLRYWYDRQHDFYREYYKKQIAKFEGLGYDEFRLHSYSLYIPYSLFIPFDSLRGVTIKIPEGSGRNAYDELIAKLYDMRKKDFAALDSEYEKMRAELRTRCDLEKRAAHNIHNQEIAQFNKDHGTTMSQFPVSLPAPNINQFIADAEKKESVLRRDCAAIQSRLEQETRDLRAVYLKDEIAIRQKYASADHRRALEIALENLDNEFLRNYDAIEAQRSLAETRCNLDLRLLGLDELRALLTYQRNVETAQLPIKKAAQLCFRSLIGLSCPVQ